MKTPRSSAKRLATSWLTDDVKTSKIVEVVWEDAAVDLDEQIDPAKANEFGKLWVRHDLGYLVSLSPDKLVLALSISPGDNLFMHSTTIPTGWVISITELDRSARCIPTKTPRRKKKAQTPLSGSTPTSASG